MMLVFSDGSEYYYATSRATDDGVKNENYDGEEEAFAKDLPGNISVEIADPGIAESHNGLIKAVKVGTTQIIVKVVGEEKPFLVLPLEVKAKAVPTTMTVTAVDDKVKLNTATSSVLDGSEWHDSVEFAVEVEDQYGRTYASDDMEITVQKASSTKTAQFKVADKVGTIIPNADGEYLVKFTAGNTADMDISGAGVLVLKFTAKDRGKTITNSTKSIQCKVAEGPISTWKLLVESSLNQRVGFKADGTTPYDDDYWTDVEIYPVDREGYKLAPEDAVDLLTTTAIETEAAKTTPEALHLFEAYSGANKLTTDGYTLANVADGFFSSIAVKTINGDKMIQKLPAKNVTIKLYEIKIDKTKADKIGTQKVLDSKAITIKDSQTSLSVKKNADHISNSTPDAIKAGGDDAAIVVKYLDNNVNAHVTFDAAFGTKSVFVKTATYAEGGITVKGPAPTTVADCILEIEGNVGYTLVVGD